MPFPNNHACLINGSLKVVGTMTRDHNGKKYSVRIGKKEDGGSADRSYLYPKDSWTEEEARAHCKDHGGSFEPATGKIQETTTPEDYADPASSPIPDE